MKIFFVTFFIAELIIAIAVISRILYFDRIVNKLNAEVLRIQSEIAMGFDCMRGILEAINCAIFEFKAYIVRKKREYLITVAKKTLFYGGFLMLKGKYKKSIIAYQVLKEIYAGYKEAEV